MSETKVPAIPAPTDANLREVARAIKGVLDVREGLLGDPLDSNVKFRDLVDGGVVNVSTVRRGNSSSVVITGPTAAQEDGYDPTTDLTPPPVPTGVTVTGLFAGVMISWNPPPASYPNHAYTEIWRASPTFTGDPPAEVAPVLGNAVRIGTDDTSTYVDYLGNNEIRYYWVRFVSQADVKGPYNATAGIRVETAKNPGVLINSLTNAIKEEQLFSTLGARINLIDAPTTGLVTKVSGLEATYGSTASAASSAAQAAASASAAALAEANALLSQTGAVTAKDQAVTAKTNAETAAANASTSATSASNSATGAAGSAATATTQATNAANSANAAGGSATAASTSASNAATSAINAGNSATAANSAKVAAESARDGAATSATAAATSAQTATTKATEAGQSATSAATSATNASTSAGNAATSATQASTSATDAAGSASSASTSATNAANSATAAGGSATAAAGSASSASTSATNAGNSASAASAAKVAAESARDAASGSASAAATSASNAATSATNAGTSASAAASSATNASTSASNALTYKNDAATSASTATTKAAEASTSAGAAATSATNSSNSASAAATSAQTASTKATEASQSATSASTSATNASTSASSAGVYASNAATSASNAAGSASAAATSFTQVQATIRGTSLGLPLEQWYLGNHSIVTITDGKAGTSALRLVGSGGSYPNQGNFVAINPGKKYRIKFWARPSSNCAGLLYFSLRQFTDSNASSPGPVNGGRSPYKPSGYSRATHISLYGDTWGEYNFVWTDTDWQSGVKFVQPEFLDNYSGAAGYWEVQGYTFTDVTDVESVSAAVQTLATTVAGPNGSTAQYTVKVDANGYVAGFGLSSSSNSAGVSTSSFAVRADQFYIATPGATTPAPQLPFIVRTTPTTINGVAVPAGVYITDGFIQNGTITNAKIGDAAIDSAKIADLEVKEGKIANGAITNLKISGTIQSSNYSAGLSGWAINKTDGSAEFGAASIRGQLTASQIDSRNLTIKDNNGNILFGVSNNLDFSRVGGVTKPADNATVGANASNFSARVGGGNLIGNSGFKRITGTLGTSGSFPVGWGEYNWAGGGVTYLVNSGGAFGTNYVRMTVGSAISGIAGIYTSATAERVIDWAVGEWFSISFWARAGNSLAVGYKLTPANSNMGWTEGPLDVANPGLSTSWQQYIYRARPGNANGQAVALGELFLSWTGTGSPSTTLPAGAIIDFCAVQVERGDVATAWTEALREKIGGDNPVTQSNISTYIASAAIDTLYIAGNAVTVPAGWEAVSDQSLASTTTGYTDRITVASINTSGQPIFVSASLFLSKVSDPFSSDSYLAVFVGSTMILEVFLPGAFGPDKQLYGVSRVVSSPGTGTVTVRIATRGFFSSQNIVVKAGSSVAAIGCKR